MITPYKNVSIIYGGSGLECALAIHSELERLHEQEHYPIKSFILAKQILSSANIVETVKGLISQSSACVIILTFDDVDESRLRQNVLIETGMAMMMVEKENCFFLSNRFPLPDDFPSDLRGFVNPNLFSSDTLGDVARQTGKEIIEHLGLESNDGLLCDKLYSYDYRAILDDIPAAILDERYDTQLDDILACWSERLASFDFVSERIIYLFERLNFLPIFSTNDALFAFIDEAKRLVKPSRADFSLYDQRFLMPICRLADDIIQYIEAKAQYFDAQRKGKDARATKAFRQTLKEIDHRLSAFLANGQFDDYNWIVNAMAYDYAALVKMKVLSLETAEGSADRLAIANEALRLYELSAQEVEWHDFLSTELWDGFLFFNIGRAHEEAYRTTNDPEDFEKMRESIERAILYRRRWMKPGHLAGAFASALSYEYFQACKWRFECSYRYAADKEAAAQDVLAGLGQIRDELDQYCGETEFGRLYAIRDDIDKFVSSIA